ncbi:Uncharacterised protein [Serratia quinivorans]|nr:Uncharacterised protein [Serratia quinivorans]CAI1573502.1 Uncharacterised protein [Serratia quinivorans]
MIKRFFYRSRVNVLYLARNVLSQIKPFSVINSLFIVLVLFIFFGLVLSMKMIISNDNEALKNYFLFLGFGGVLLSFTYNLRRHVSEDYFKEAKEQLGKSFDIIDCVDHAELTKDRLKWLTTARMLKTSERLSKKIMMTSHKELYIEEKQYYRIKFKELIGDFPDGFFDDSLDYFRDPINSDKSSLSDDSIFTVMSFVIWDERYKDPLGDFFESVISEEEKRKVRRSAPDNLRAYLEERDRIRDERSKRKQDRKERRVI